VSIVNKHYTKTVQSIVVALETVAFYDSKIDMFNMSSAVCTVFYDVVKIVVYNVN